MKRLISIILLVTVLTGLVACGGSDNEPITAAIAQSDKPRETTPAMDQTVLRTLVDGNSAFTFNLYGQLKYKDGNLFYSPFSISQALAMTYGGARGDTEREMAVALQFNVPQSQLHPAFNSLDLQLAQRGQQAKGADGGGFRLHVVNAIWGQRGFPFLPDYLDLLAQNYGAGIRLLDFVNSAEGSREVINEWVSQQTEGRIKDLLPAGSIDDLTRLVLTNAIYFNAAWVSQFQPESTTDGWFHLLAGGDVSVRMMHQTQSLGYTQGNGYQAVELPYDGNELSMVVVLPQANEFHDFENGLTAQVVDGIIQDMKHREVSLSMPKFKVESEFGLNDALGAMGMPIAFTTDADFSGMDGRKDLLITDVVHKAYVSVDENGTEAAAATGVVVGVTSMPSEPVEVTIDHPFVFLIRDIETGAILFVGRIMNPAA